MSDTPAAAVLREALQADVDEQRRDMALVALLRSDMREASREGIRDGMREVMTDPEMWGAVVAALQDQAAKRTGQFILGGLKAAAVKLVWIGLLVLTLWSVGGWAAIKGVYTMTFGAKP